MSLRSLTYLNSCLSWNLPFTVEDVLVSIRRKIGGMRTGKKCMSDTTWRALSVCHRQPQPGLHTDLGMTCVIMELVENCETPASLLTSSKLSNEAHIQQGHIYWETPKGQRPIFCWHYNPGLVADTIQGSIYVISLFWRNVHRRWNK
jgi:hypothetical protein